MSEAIFGQFDETLRGQGAAAAFDRLAGTLREDKKYPQLFELRLMEARHRLGLPLILNETPSNLSPEQRQVYDEVFLRAAREVGRLFLADGDIGRAWPYLRAVGETAPVTEAIERLPLEGESDGIDAVIEIALGERLLPRKGFELILARYGTCRAISFFEQYPDRATREDVLRLLVNHLHNELTAGLKRAIVQVEGSEPDTNAVAELVAGRDWLFGEYCYYIDTSHLLSVIRFALESSDPEILRKTLDLTAYGRKLSPQFQYKSEPPFDDFHADHAVFLRALLGEEVDAAVEHFRRKIAEHDPEQAGDTPAQVLVSLLVRTGRYGEAARVYREHLSDADPRYLRCPTLPELCQMAGDYGQLMEVARERGDVLTFVAGALGKLPQ